VATGVLASQSKLNIVVVIVVASAGAITGDNGGYWLRAKGGCAPLSGRWVLARAKGRSQAARALVAREQARAEGAAESRATLRQARRQDRLLRPLRRGPAHHRRLDGRDLPHAVVAGRRLQRRGRHPLGDARRPRRVLQRPGRRKRDPDL